MSRPNRTGLCRSLRDRASAVVLRRSIVACALAWLATPELRALDEVVLTNGRHYTGTVITSTPESIVLSIDGGTVEFPRSSVASPPYLGPIAATDRVEPPHAAVEIPLTNPSPLPTVAVSLHRLREFTWGTDVRQVPVIVADRGRWQSLPGVAFVIGNFCQLSFYGDPSRPAAIEISLFHPPAEAWDQKRELLEYMMSIVPDLATDSRLDHLNLGGDSFAIGDLWFAVSPPESKESPGRWAVLIMHELSIPPSRATVADLQTISEPVSSATVVDPSQPRTWQRASWTPTELAWLRDTVADGQPTEAAKKQMLAAQPWTALGGERVFIRSFTRDHGKYARSSNDWLREVAATP